MKKKSFFKGVVIAYFLMVILLPFQSVKAQSSDCSTPACAVNKLEFATGFDHQNNTLFPNLAASLDPYWRVTTSPFSTTLPSIPYIISPNSAWQTLPNARWISMYPISTSWPNNELPLDAYTYEYEFCSCTDGNVLFDLDVLVDDSCEVYVDNTLLFSSFGGFSTVSNLIGTTNLTAGTHKLKFLVRNTGSHAMGISVAGEITGASFIKKMCCSAISNYISGIKFNDLNANGIQDAGELGIPNWTIQLTSSTSGPVTATTDQFGYYRFMNVANGNYTISEQQQNGWTQTYPTSSTHQVNLTGGSAVVADFGNIKTASGRVSGRKYFDNNPIGTIDASDSPLNNWTIKLTNTVTNATYTTTTASGGYYYFQGLVPGNYKVEEIIPSGWQQTYPGGNQTHTFTLNLAESKSGFDFGNRLSMFNGNSTLKGVKFNDLNANGLFDIGEPTLAGWPIKLMDAGSNVLLQITTDQSGAYSFTNLPAGAYIVGEDQQNLSQTYPQTLTHSLNLQQNQTVSGLNFGNVNLSTGEDTRLCGTKYLDVNQNGVLDPADTPLSGWVIHIRDLSGNIVSTTTTNSKGEFCFQHIVPGNYTVCEENQSGYVQLFPTQNACHNIVLISGSYLLNINFLNGKAQEPGRICGYKFLDENCDGKWGKGEPGLADWKIELVDANGNVVATTSTDADGKYCFDKVEPGNYSVREVQQPGYTQSYPNPYAHQVAIAYGEHYKNLNFGNCKETVGTALLCGKKMQDFNCNGKIDSNDVGIEGWKIHIENSTAGTSTTVETNPDGTWCLEVKPGKYVVTEEHVSGWVQTYPVSPQDYIITVSAGDVYNNLVFLNCKEKLQGSICGRKFRDLACKGVNEPIYPGLSGWVIELRDASGTVIQTATTNASGGYCFKELGQGTYSVLEQQQAGWTQTYPQSGSHSIQVTSLTEHHVDIDFGNCKEDTTSHTGCSLDPACLANSLNISTGVNHNTGALYSTGVQDAFYNLTSVPGNANVNLPSPVWTIDAHSAWHSFSNAKWVSPYQSANFNTNNPAPDNPYTFETCFCLCDDDTVQLDFSVLADDYVDVYLDSILVKDGGTTSHFSQANMIDVDTTMVLSGGSHCLRFEVRNIGSHAMGLAVEGFVHGAHVLGHACCNPSSSICGTKFNDIDQNGAQANATTEQGLENWVIVLSDASGSPIDTALTDIHGNYCFNNLGAGSYSVAEVNQSGWTQTYPASPGVHNITLSTNEVKQAVFGNHKDSDVPCDTIISETLDSICCMYDVSIFNFNGNILSIEYVITGGVLEQLTSNNCPFVSPAQVGSTSGTMVFSPACANDPSLSLQVTPTTGSGIVQVQWTVNHHKKKKCVLNSTYNCKRAPIVECDSLAVAPFVFTGLDLSGRTFTIFNDKSPQNPICGVNISLNPSPTFGWNGGGLKIDGTSTAWGYPYQSIQIPGGANNTVEFNLGVDWTIGWSGDVLVDVIHCDGDTCKLVFPNWKAVKPTRVAPFATFENEPLKDRLIATSFKIGQVETERAIKWISVMTENDDQKVYAISGADIHSDEEEVEVSLVKSSMNDQLALFELNKAVNFDQENLMKLIHLVIETKESIGSGIIITLYDESGQPVVSSLHKIEKDKLEKVTNDGGDQSNFKLIKATPNPAKDESVVHFINDETQPIKLELIDVKGNVLQVLSNQSVEAGYQALNVNLSRVQPGQYFLRLSSKSNKSSLSLIVN